MTTPEVNLTDAQWVALVKAWKEQVKPIEDSVRQVLDATEPLVADLATSKALFATSFNVLARKLIPLLAVLTPAQQNIIVAKYEAMLEGCKTSEAVVCKLLPAQVAQLKARDTRGGKRAARTRTPLGSRRTTAAHAAPATPSQVPARTLLADAVKTARMSHKVILLYCYTDAVNDFLHSAEVGKLIADNYVLVRFDTVPGSRAVARELGLNGPGFLFADSMGKTLAVWDMAFPQEDGWRIWEFVRLLGQAAPRLTEADRRRIVDYLVANSRDD